MAPDEEYNRGLHFFTMAFNFYYDNQFSTQNEKQPVCIGEVQQSL